MLVFDTLGSGRIHGAKSASRRNTIGHTIATSIDHVTSGHCHRAGSDHCQAPRSERIKPTSGRIQITSSPQLSLPSVARKIAGVR